MRKALHGQYPPQSSIQNYVSPKSKAFRNMEIKRKNIKPV
jgi:hypothetical protein